MKKIITFTPYNIITFTLRRFLHLHRTPSCPSFFPVYSTLYYCPNSLLLFRPFPVSFLPLFHPLQSLSSHFHTFLSHLLILSSFLISPLFSLLCSPVRGSRHRSNRAQVTGQQRLIMDTDNTAGTKSSSFSFLWFRTRQSTSLQLFDFLMIFSFFIFILFQFFSLLSLILFVPLSVSLTCTHTHTHTLSSKINLLYFTSRTQLEHVLTRWAFDTGPRASIPVPADEHSQQRSCVPS